ncbi:phosphotransferase [Congregibacter brevis]|uniref:Phosphotransferase n=1 Tax=Congregibacter brevis TaxID=3081201 RepID=A0ABZ0IA26_9GAMM|nr:phosphotransferase [Congregibacter sp. IMCC45268]
MVDKVEQLNELMLSQYLQANIEGFEGPLTTQKFDEGQSNPTFLLRAKSGKYVLRRKPPGVLLPSAHAVDREFRVIRALENTDVPVPKVYHLCEDTAVIGSAFYVMSFVPGKVYSDQTLPDKNNDDRRAMNQEIIRVLAEIHSVDVDTAGLSDYGKAGNYFERQVSRWTKQYRAAETENVPAMEKLMSWLSDNMPADAGQVSLIHGDYRLGNVMFEADGTQMLAVVDWELSTLGNPLADLAYFCMYDIGMVELTDSERAELGLPSEAELVQLYCDLRGLPSIDNWHFYSAFSHFRLASISQGVYKRALDGNASQKNAIEAGEGVKLLAQKALQIIDEAGAG